MYFMCVQVLMTVWALANKEPYQTIGDRFEFSNRRMTHITLSLSRERVKKT